MQRVPNTAGATQSSSPIRRAARLPPANRQRARPRKPEIPERSTTEIPQPIGLSMRLGEAFRWCRPTGGILINRSGHSWKVLEPGAVREMSAALKPVCQSLALRLFDMR